MITKYRNLIRRRASRLRRDERGAQIAELALTVPLLVVMLASIAEFGRLFQTYNTLAKATREGTRYLSTARPYDSTAITQAKNVVVCGRPWFCAAGEEVVSGLTTDNVVVDPTANPINVTVSITGYQHEPLFDLGALMNDSNFSLRVALSPSTTMRYIQE